jgi:hypothetical protein
MLQSLTCRSEGGPRDEDLKMMYMNCIKKPENNKNNSVLFGFKDHKKEFLGRFNQKTDWNKDLRNRGDDMRDRVGGTESRERFRSRDDITINRDRLASRNDRDRMGSRDDRRDSEISYDYRIGDRDNSRRIDNNYNHYMSSNGGYGAEQFNDKYNHQQNNGYDGVSMYITINRHTHCKTMFLIDFLFNK